MFYLDEVGCFDVEKVFSREKHTEWTAFERLLYWRRRLHVSKISIDTIRRLKCQLNNISEDDALYEVKEDCWLWGLTEEKCCKEYSGCIFKSVVSGDVIVEFIRRRK